MFGYVRPFRPELKCKDFDLYQATYGGLCRCLRRRTAEESALILRPYSRDGQKSGCGLRGSFCLSCWCCFWQRQALRGIAILPSGI